MNTATVTTRLKWVNGQETEAKKLHLELDMNLLETVTKKGNKFRGLAEIGSQFGGECIGFDDKGNQVMCKCSVYLKAPNGSKPKSNFRIG